MTSTLEMPAPSEAIAAEDRMTIVAFSGDMDKLIACMSIANSAAAMGKKVTVFFTFWGMSAIRRRRSYGSKPWLDRALTFMMPARGSAVGLSRMNMFGAGPRFFRHLMNKKKVAGVEQLIQTGLEMGIDMVACSMSLDVMGIGKDELIDGVQFGGAAACVRDISKSGSALFI